MFLYSFRYQILYMVLRVCNEKIFFLEMVLGKLVVYVYVIEFRLLFFISKKIIIIYTMI